MNKVVFFVDDYMIENMCASAMGVFVCAKEERKRESG